MGKVVEKIKNIISSFYKHSVVVHTEHSEGFVSLDLTGHNKTISTKDFDTLEQHFKNGGDIFHNLIVKPTATSQHGELNRITILCMKKRKYDLWIKEKEEQKNNDHRTLNQKMKIFALHDQIGAGFPIWLENGCDLKERIKKIVNDVQKKYGIRMISTPILGTKSLYQKSGHWQHYQENMFITQDDLILRPMSCPHHIIFFQYSNFSYKDLPVWIGENALIFRKEFSGGLGGLERVRSMELIDTHVFTTDFHIIDNVKTCYEIIMQVMETFDIAFDKIELSIRGEGKNYSGNSDVWAIAERDLKTSLQQLQVPFEEVKGEAAFYGPKIDFQIFNNSGKKITLSTIQLDFQLPENFNLACINLKNNEIEKICMIHLGIIGTLERFVAYLLEKNKGNLKQLSPTQIILIPKSLEFIDAATTLQKKLEQQGFRVVVDESDETMSKKIAVSRDKKIPLSIVVGQREVDSNFSSVIVKPLIGKSFGQNLNDGKLQVLGLCNKSNER